MLAIHGIWADDALLLWAEDATRPAPVSAGRPGPAEARPHPGAASPAALAAALAGLPGEAAELAWSGAEGELVLWLPGTTATPQASPELTAAPGDGTWLASAGGGRVILRAWRVPVLSFPASAALPLLAGLGHHATAGHPAGSDDALLPIGPDGELTDSGPGAETADEVIFGQSVPFLAACAALAADLVTRGRLLPALTRLAAPNDAARLSLATTPTALAPSESAGISAPATGPGPPPRAEAVAGMIPPASSGSAGPSASATTPARVAGPGSVAPSGPATGPGSPSGAEGIADSAAAALAGSYAARWRPVVSGADAQRVRELAQAMPPVCRATSEAGEPAAAVLARLLDALTDAAARSSLATDPEISLLPPRRGRRPAKVSVTERWAAALTAADPAFEVSGPADEDEAAVLAADLAAWHAAAQVPPGPVRTCFRLIEPPLEEPETAAASGSAGTSVTNGVSDAAGVNELGGESPATPAAEPGVTGGDTAGRRDWAVEFALQSADDPSLVLPASDIWAGAVTGWGAGASGSSGPGIGYPEEELLTGLGRASRLFPELDAELRTAAPAAVSLDTAGAWKFVQEAGPLLSGAGFGVLLPDWARQRRLGLRISARSTPAAPGSTATGKPMFGLADMIDFRYELALGDVPLDPAELEELARLKVPLVRLRGQWVELTQDQLKAAVRFMERRGAQAGRMRAGDLLSAELHGTGDDLPVTSISADGWLGDLLASRDGQRLEPARTPDSFRGLLRPYQERGLAWLSFLGGLGVGGVLADDMGLGKTIQLLALLAREQDEHAERPGSDDIPGPGPSLLVCPMSVVGNWEREAAQFTPQLTVHTHHGAGRLTGEELSAAVAAADLVITSYGVATRDREALRQVTWHRVICDEAQNIKNAATRQAQAVRSLPAVSRIALTGTPVENRLADLWSIMEFTSQGLLGPAEKFRKTYSVPIERNGDEAATERLKLVTGPFILRRLKTDRSIIADLPDKLEMKVWCNLTPEQDRGRRWHRAAGAGAGHDGQAQAGLQPPGAPARRRLPAAGPVRQAGPAGGDLRRGGGRRREGAVLHAVRRVRPDAAAAPGRPAGLPRVLAARRHSQEAARRDG
jgi:hypothetical protein